MARRWVFSKDTVVAIVYADAYDLRVGQQRLNAALADQTLNALNGETIDIEQIANTLQELNVSSVCSSDGHRHVLAGSPGKTCFPKISRRAEAHPDGATLH